MSTVKQDANGVPEEWTLLHAGVNRLVKNGKDYELRLMNDIADKDPLANLKAVATRRAKVCGTKLFRVWKGKKYEVTVGAHGKYILNGEEFKSLSAVARRITGTKWNGKTFFGVKS